MKYNTKNAEKIAQALRDEISFLQRNHKKLGTRNLKHSLSNVNKFLQRLESEAGV